MDIKPKPVFHIPLSKSSDTPQTRTIISSHCFKSRYFQVFFLHFNAIRKIVAYILLVVLMIVLWRSLSVEFINDSRLTWLSVLSLLFGYASLWNIHWTMVSIIAFTHVVNRDKQILFLDYITLNFVVMDSFCNVKFKKFQHYLAQCLAIFITILHLILEVTDIYFTGLYTFYIFSVGTCYFVLVEEQIEWKSFSSNFNLQNL